MKFNLVIFVGLVGLSLVSCDVREAIARQTARKCVFSEKVSYDVAFKFSKGDFSDDSRPAKCFLKCFAYNIGFFNSTGDFQKEELMKYVEYVVPTSIEVGGILDKCASEVAKDEDDCDYVFRVYKCFWDGIREAEAAGSARFSLYDILGFSRLSDEEEISADNETYPEETIVGL